MLNTRTYKIYFEQLDENGNVIGRGVYCKEYKNYGNAQRIAKERFGDTTKFRYEINWRNPYKEYFSETVCCLCGTICRRQENSWGGYVTGQRIRLSKWDSTLPLSQKYGQTLHLPCGDLCDCCFDAIMKTVNDLRKGNDNDLQRTNEN